MILVIDNYDSFTYNLVHLLYTLTPQVLVRRNREITVDEVLALRPEAIVLSPGPGRPEKAFAFLDRDFGREFVPLAGRNYEILAVDLTRAESPEAEPGEEEAPGEAGAPEEASGGEEE